MNTNYPLTMEKAFAGSLADCGYTDKVSVPAGETIQFGTAVVRDKGGDVGHIGRSDVTTITFDAALITGNKINGKINGTSIAEVTFNDTNLHTLELLVLAIIAVAPTAVCTIDGTGRIVRVETDNLALTSSNFAVTAGNSQAGVTSVNSMDGVFAGVAVHNHNVAGKYELYDSMSVLKRGRIMAVSSVAMTKDDDVYVDIAGGLSKFTNVSTNNLATGGKVIEGNSGAGVFQLEL